MTDSLLTRGSLAALAAPIPSERDSVYRMIAYWDKYGLFEAAGTPAVHAQTGSAVGRHYPVDAAYWCALMQALAGVGLGLADIRDVLRSCYFGKAELDGWLLIAFRYGETGREMRQAIGDDLQNDWPLFQAQNPQMESVIVIHIGGIFARVRARLATA